MWCLRDRDCWDHCKTTGNSVTYPKSDNPHEHVFSVRVGFDGSLEVLACSVCIGLPGRPLGVVLRGRAQRSGVCGTYFVRISVPLL